MFSFIVPVKNGLSLTRALVDTARATNPGAQIEWVIVDSGSTDGTLEFCREIGAAVVPFRSEPFNYCAAINAGAEKATGGLWIIANNDIEFRSEGDLARIERIFREWPVMGVLSPGRPAGPAELEFRYEGINGATWVTRPDCFRAWGGMPEAMSGYGYDESYTAIQCWRRGLALGWLTGWNVFHHGSATFGPLGGTVPPALRRNLSRLLKLMDAADLDRPGDPALILQRMRERERLRAPWLLNTGEQSSEWLRRQGFSNARPFRKEAPAGGEPALLLFESATRDECQWLPWLANELLLQPAAQVVGARGWMAVRQSAVVPLNYREGNMPEMREELAPLAKAVGPPPPRLMPALAHPRPSLIQRLMARFSEWRAKEKDLPEGW